MFFLSCFLLIGNVMKEYRETTFNSIYNTYGVYLFGSFMLVLITISIYKSNVSGKTIEAKPFVKSFFMILFMFFYVDILEGTRDLLGSVNELTTNWVGNKFNTVFDNLTSSSLQEINTNSEKKSLPINEEVQNIKKAIEISKQINIENQNLSDDLANMGEKIEGRSSSAISYFSIAGVCMRVMVFFSTFLAYLLIMLGDLYGELAFTIYFVLGAIFVPFSILPVFASAINTFAIQIIKYSLISPIFYIGCNFVLQLAQVLVPETGGATVAINAISQTPFSAGIISLILLILSVVGFFYVFKLSSSIANTLLGSQSAGGNQTMSSAMQSGLTGGIKKIASATGYGSLANIGMAMKYFMKK